MEKIANIQHTFFKAYTTELTRNNTFLLKTILAFLIFFPVFFQLPFNIYNNPATLKDPAGFITRLPIPISVPVCFLGIFLVATFKRVFQSSWLVLLSCTGMVLTSLISAHLSVTLSKWKLLFFQYLIPMFAFVLGYTFDSRERSGTSLGYGLMGAVIVIVPSQLMSTWLIEKARVLQATGPSFGFADVIPEICTYLSDKVFIFYIYQHLQYASAVIVIIYLSALFGLSEHRRFTKVIYIFTPLIGVYAAASTSLTSIGCLFIGLMLFCFYSWFRFNRIFPVFVMTLTIALTIGYMSLAACKDNGNNLFTIKFSYLSKLGFFSCYQTNKIDAKNLPAKSHIGERIYYWKYYINKISKSPFTLLYGHTEQPDIKIIPSAHNYYLDFVYNFGLVASIPLIYYIFTTLALLIRHYRSVYASSQLLGLTVSVFLFLLVDNFVKVGMRQLYPGIATFFLWGYLLHKLKIIDANSK